MYKLGLVILGFFYISNCSKIKVKEPDMSTVNRPCAYDDLKCIQKEFRRKGWCPIRKQHRFKNGRLYVPELLIPLPYFNVTDSTNNVVFTGLQNGKVVEFYINQKTGNSVFTVDFKDFEVFGEAILYYHRSLKEDIVITADITEQYKSVEVTTIIPKGRKGVEKSESHARISSDYKYDFGEGLDDIKNEEIQALFKAFNKSPTIAVQDLYLIRSPVMFRFYVDHVICSESHSC